MEKEELEKLGAVALADIVHGELIALTALIKKQQEEIDKINSTPNHNLTTFFCEKERLGGYTVARDMLLRFIDEHTAKQK